MAKQPKTEFDVITKPSFKEELKMEKAYRKSLRELGKNISKSISPLLRAEKEKKRREKQDSIVDSINDILDLLLLGIDDAKEFALTSANSILATSNKQFNAQVGLQVASTPNQILGVNQNITPELQSKLQEATRVSTDMIVTWESASEDYARAWMRDNENLFTTIHKNYIEDIRKRINSNFASGYHLKDLTKDIMRIGNLKMSDAKRIARTENGKLQAEATVNRMEKGGVKVAVWRAIMDERTRTGNIADGCNHRSLDGTEFDPTKGVKVNGGYIFPAGKSTGSVKGCAVISCRCSQTSKISLENIVSMAQGNTGRPPQG